MGYRRHSIAPGEWYHCYTRGIDKRTTFEDELDYQRFQQALYLSNSNATVDRNNIKRRTHAEIFYAERGTALVAVGAYALMPNHFHLLVKELVEGGLVKFMQKLGTSYTMYFNTRRERTGALFVGPFRSRHVADDRYFGRVVPYIHLNPVEIFEPRWKEGMVRNIKILEEKILTYPYSSLLDYLEEQRPESAIIDANELMTSLDKKIPSLEVLLPEMREYYQDLNM